MGDRHDVFWHISVNIHANNHANEQAIANGAVPPLIGQNAPENASATSSMTHTAAGV